MNIFRFLSSKKIMEICFKTHQITPFKKIELPSKLLATPRVARRFAACHPPSPPPWRILYTPMDYYKEIYLKRCARRIHADRQLIVCSTLYVYVMQNLFRGK